MSYKTVANIVHLAQGQARRAHASGAGSGRSLSVSSTANCPSAGASPPAPWTALPASGPREVADLTTAASLLRRENLRQLTTPALRNWSRWWRTAAWRVSPSLRRSDGDPANWSFVVAW